MYISISPIHSKYSRILLSYLQYNRITFYTHAEHLKSDFAYTSLQFTKKKVMTVQNCGENKCYQLEQGLIDFSVICLEADVLKTW